MGALRRDWAPWEIPQRSIAIESLSFENGELTVSGKIRRAAVEARYAEQIERAYEGS
jgi:long-subunit acyl-CoA synthetase (AMP-forming)